MTRRRRLPGRLVFGAMAFTAAVTAGSDHAAVAATEGGADDPRVAKAQTACLSNDLDTGVRVLAELYTETGDVRWLFNQARCYQQNNKPDLALNRFREFLRAAPQSETDLRGRATKYVEELEHRENVGAPLAQIDLTAKPPIDDHAAAGDPRLRTAAIVLGSVGVAGLATGVVFSWRGQAKKEEIRHDGELTTLLDPAEERRKYDDGERLARWQWPAYLAGGALIAGAAACYVLSVRGHEGKAAASIVVSPIASAQSAGVAATLRF